MVAALTNRETLVRIVVSALLGMAIVLGIAILGTLVAALAEAAFGNPSTVIHALHRQQMFELRPSANSERLSTWVRALEMFRDAPIFGHGLGAFIGQINRSDGSFVVVHSTYLWILARPSHAG